MVTKTKKPLSKLQKAQRKYASAMRSVRSRAAAKAGGRGRISKRRSASGMRRMLGLGVRKRKR